MYAVQPLTVTQVPICVSLCTMYKEVCFIGQKVCVAQERYFCTFPPRPSQPSTRVYMYQIPVLVKCCHAPSLKYTVGLLPPSPTVSTLTFLSSFPATLWHITILEVATPLNYRVPVPLPSNFPTLCTHTCSSVLLWFVADCDHTR